MPTNLRRHQSSDRAQENETGHARARDLEESSAHESPLHRLHNPAQGYADALTRSDRSAGARLLNTLQQTLGNGHVQRLIASLGQRSPQIDRCADGSCGGAAEEEPIRRIQRIGQAPQEIEVPRGASLASPVASPHREEEEPRSPAHR
jgi:hypothetical protein